MVYPENWPFWWLTAKKPHRSAGVRVPLKQCLDDVGPFVLERAGGVFALACR
jgi:hypothetical protein